jgi:hypothetical protein
MTVKRVSMVVDTPHVDTPHVVNHRASIVVCPFSGHSRHGMGSTSIFRPQLKDLPCIPNLNFAAVHALKA